MDKTKLFFFLIKHKIFITLSVPLLFFIIVMFFVISSNVAIQESLPSPSPTPNSSLSPRPSRSSDENNIENLEGLENLEGAQKTEELSDGMVKYYFPSSVVARQNIFITKGEGGGIIFERFVVHPNLPVKTSAFTNSYGPAKWIFKGSKFYGLTMQVNIYPELGLAFIANPETNNVLEQHIFEPTSIENYIRNYGEDIPAQP